MFLTISYILLSSDTSSLNTNNGSQVEGDNIVVPQSLILGIVVGKGWFMNNNHHQQKPRSKLEELMKDDMVCNLNNDPAITSPFKGIGEEKIWEKIRKPLSPKLREGNHAICCENTIDMLNAIKHFREENRETLKSIHDRVKMLQALASNMKCIVHNDRGDDTCEDNLIDHKI